MSTSQPTVQITADLHQDVWVKLTPAGVAMLDAEIEKVRSAIDPAPCFECLRALVGTSWNANRHEYRKFQFSELMYIFGPKCIAGAEPPFEEGKVFLTKPLS